MVRVDDTKPSYIFTGEVEQERLVHIDNYGSVSAW